MKRVSKSIFLMSFRQKGLTLVEVAIVLVILGLLIGLGASLIGPLTKRAKITETKETLNANVEAIISWAAGNKRLPDFVENFSSCTNNSNDFRCVVKNRNDAWGRLFYYVVDSDLAQKLTTATEHKICDRSKTKITVRFCRDLSCSDSQEIPNVAFLLFSPGENGNDQTFYSESFNGTSLVINIYEPGLKIDRYSSSQSSSCQINKNVNGYPQDRCNQEEEYDDIVKWITLDELRTKVGCQTSPLRIITNQLISGIKGQSYEAKIIADGGTPFPDGNDTGNEREYEWCVETRGGIKPANLAFKTTYGEEVQFNDFTKNLNLDPNSQEKDFRCLTTSDQNDWKKSDYLILSGTPNSTYSDYIIIYVRDNQSPIKNLESVKYALNISDMSTGQNLSDNPPPGSQVSFANNINQFQPQENNPNAVSVVGNTVILGGNTHNTSGCFWYPSAYHLSGKTMRAFFKFKFLTIDTSSTSTQYADGFTFAVATSSLPNTACGGLGVDIGFGGLGYDSVALEIDTYPNSGTWRYDPANNHVAIVRNGNNSHSGNNPTCPSDGCVAGSNATWLEDGVEHTARVEILTGCNPACNNCGNNPQNYAFFKVWIDCPASSCRDLNQNYTATPTISHCFQLPSSMNSVKFGFTEGTGGAVQQIEISDFGIGFF